MPFLSLLKKLVVGDDSASPQTQPEAEPQQQPESKPQQQPESTAELPPKSPHAPPLLPPPPLSSPPSSQPNTADPNSTSMTSLRTQVESERQTASQASKYSDFTGGGHADAGHWNDPPTVVFKAQGQAAKKKAADTASETSSFMVVDSAVTPNATAVAAGAPSVDVPEQRDERIAVVTRVLHAAVDSVPLDSATPMVKRMAEDTGKRLAVLDERLPELDDVLVGKVCEIALLIDKGLLLEAADAHRNLMQAGHEAELKWLVGVKRAIELCQKMTT